MRAIVTTTRSRLLDAAEEILRSEGLHALTVREVTRLAGVNLAAVNYSFGTKDSLLIGVQERMFAAMTQERLRRLNELSDRESFTPTELVAALVEPLEEMRIQHGEAAVQLHRHLTAHPEGTVRDASWGLLLPVIDPFTELLARLLPDEDGGTLSRRVHILCQVMYSSVLDPLDATALGAEPTDPQSLTQFLVGGLTTGTSVQDNPRPI